MLILPLSMSYVMQIYPFHILLVTTSQNQTSKKEAWFTPATNGDFLASLICRLKFPNLIGLIQNKK